MPTWVAALVALAEAIDPALAPYLNLATVLFGQVTSAHDFSQPQTFGPIPGSVQKHAGSWTVTWTPT